MHVGARWSYSISGKLEQSIAEVRVLREVSVDGAKGFLLSGPMGESRLAWKDDRLLLGRSPNCVFEPAIPILVQTAGDVRRKWSGKLRGIWGEEPAEAILDQSRTEEQVGGRKMRVVKSFLSITGQKHRLRLQTFFQEGNGIVAQKQWTDGDLIVSLEWLSGE